jgi:hypothetical protein
MISAKAILAFTALLILVTSPALSQAALLGENCDLSVLGATDTKTFLEFDREFRYALSTPDAGMMALLVKPSLRVSDERGTFYIEDARSLQSRFQDIFTPAMRDVVLKQPPEKLRCNNSGVMYGDGTVWVGYTGLRYALTTINVPVNHPPKGPEKRIEFVCNSDNHRVIVDAVDGGPPHYRAWTKPHSLTEKPDLEISGGKREFQGSSVCAYEVWSFTSGGAAFVLEGPGGCYEDSKEPPADTRGMLAVIAPGKPAMNWWCR